MRCFCGKVKKPSFGFPNQKKRTHCSFCKTNEMCDLKHEKCIVCNKFHASFGIKKRTHCGKCKTKEMHDLKHKFCIHGIERRNCVECTTIEQRIQNKRFCQACTETRIGKKRQLTSVLCAKCEGILPPIWEKIIWGLIADKVPPPSFQEKSIGGCQSDKTRLDNAWIWLDRIVHLEVDGGSHRDREISCELKKLDSANFGFDGIHLPTMFIRFNPSAYDHRLVSLETRIKMLVDVINKALTEDITHWDKHGANVIFMYYHSKASKHIHAAQSSTGSIKVHKIFE